MSGAVPLLWRLVALGCCGLAVWLLGWMQGQVFAGREQQAHELARQSAVSQQAVRVEKTQAAQSAVNVEVSHVVETRLADVRRHYASRLRQQPPIRSSPVPPVASASGSADAATADPGSAPGGHGLRAESYDDLAARCAVTTVIALGWQQREAAMQAVSQTE